MIDTGSYDDFGKEREFISIDLRTPKHKNRVIDFFEKKNMLNDEYQYSIKAQWTDSKFHPDMTMSEKELIEFASALNSWVQKTKARQDQGV